MNKELEKELEKEMISLFMNDKNELTLIGYFALITFALSFLKRKENK